MKLKLKEINHVTGANVDQNYMDWLFFENTINTYKTTLQARICKDTYWYD